MALYKYRAKTATGETVEGTFDVATQDAVITLLRGKGMYPLSIKEGELKDSENFLERFQKISARDRIIFFRQFHTMLKAGMNIVNCLALLKKQTENPKLAKIIGKIYDDVNRGVSLSEGMSKYEEAFPSIITSMIEIGEVSGTLETVLDRVAVFLEKENKIKSKLKSAMMYPAIIGAISLLIVTFMVLFIVPKFVGMFATMNMQMPTPTKILYETSLKIQIYTFIYTDNLKKPYEDEIKKQNQSKLEGLSAKERNAVEEELKTQATLAILNKSLLYHVIIDSVLLIGFFFTKNLLKNDKVKYIRDAWILKIPLIGKNIKKIMTSRMARALGLMLRSGVTLVQAVEISIRLLKNKVIQKGLEKSKVDIMEGASLSKALEKVDVFPVMMLHMIAIGEESGALEEIVEKVGDYYDDDIDNSITRLLAIVEPVMILAMALVVGGIVFAMILPIFSMYQGVGK